MNPLKIIVGVEGFMFGSDDIVKTAKSLMKHWWFNETTTDKFIDNVFEKFVESNSTNYTYFKEIYDVISDVTFNNAIYKYAIETSAKEENTVFVYRFDYTHGYKKWNGNISKTIEK